MKFSFKISLFTVRILVLFFLLTSNLYAQNIDSDSDSKEDDVNVTSVKQIDIILQQSFDANISNPRKSLRLAKKAKRVSTRLKYSKGVIDADLIIGALFFDREDYKGALEIYKEALEISQLKFKKDTTLKIKILNLTGNAYKANRNYSEAQKLYESALEINIHNQNEAEITNSYINLSNLYYQSGDSKKSQDYLIKASKLIESTRSKKNADPLGKLGNAYDKRGEFAKALDYFEQSLQIYKDQNDYSGIATTLVSIGYIHYNLKDFNKADRYFHEALSIGKEKNIKIAILESYQGLSHISSQSQDYKKAYELYKKYINIKDSILEEDKQEEITKMKSKLQIEINKKEIDLLKQEKENQKLEYNNNKIIARSSFWGLFLTILLLGVLIYLYIDKRKSNLKLETTRLELENLNATKNKFFSIIAHDLKSPIASLSGFLQILIAFPTSIKPEEIKSFAIKIDQSVNSLKEMMTNVLKWSQSQMDNIQLNIEDLSPYTLAENVVNIYKSQSDDKEILLIQNGDSNLTCKADKDMLEFIIHNLIHNAIKFTKRKGKVEINIYEKNDKVFVSVSDSGVGINEEIQNKIFNLTNLNHSRGTENEMGTGLGLILCKEFAEKMKAQFSFISKVNEGSKFTICMSK